jgi:hypothetical protein
MSRRRLAERQTAQNRAADVSVRSTWFGAPASNCAHHNHTEEAVVDEMESGRARPFASRHRAPGVRCEWAASRFAYPVISTFGNSQNKKTIVDLFGDRRGHPHDSVRLRRASGLGDEDGTPGGKQTTVRGEKEGGGIRDEG